MSVPDEVLGLLADLRELLQNKMEPPVYVSDRRLVKAIALLKVRGQAWSCSLVPPLRSLVAVRTFSLAHVASSICSSRVNKINFQTILWLRLAAGVRVHQRAQRGHHAGLPAAAAPDVAGAQRGGAHRRVAAGAAGRGRRRAPVRLPAQQCAACQRLMSQLNLARLQGCQTASLWLSFGALPELAAASSLLLIMQFVIPCMPAHRALGGVTLAAPPELRAPLRHAGLFSRAVKSIGNKSQTTAIAEEASELRRVLAQKLTEVRWTPAHSCQCAWTAAACTPMPRSPVEITAPPVPLQSRTTRCTA